MPRRGGATSTRPRWPGLPSRGASCARWWPCGTARRIATASPSRCSLGWSRPCRKCCRATACRQERMRISSTTCRFPRAVPRRRRWSTTASCASTPRRPWSLGGRASDWARSRGSSSPTSPNGWAIWGGRRAGPRRARSASRPSTAKTPHLGRISRKPSASAARSAISSRPSPRPTTRRGGKARWRRLASCVAARGRMPSLPCRSASSTSCGSRPTTSRRRAGAAFPARAWWRTAGRATGTARGAPAPAASPRGARGRPRGWRSPAAPCRASKTRCGWARRCVPRCSTAWAATKRPRPHRPPRPHRQRRRRPRAPLLPARGRQRRRLDRSRAAARGGRSRRRAAAARAP